MKKLHVDGLLESLDYESLDACKPCLMGKMTKTPFFGTMERATDLLEIIHTDVRSAMSVEARGGCRYFCWKYALEAIIKWLLLYFLIHDNCLLFML